METLLLLGFLMIQVQKEIILPEDKKMGQVFIILTKIIDDEVI